MNTPSLRQTWPIWGKIGLLSFGGPAAQIALMHRLVVDRYKWLSEKDYLSALSFCMLLPGPEAMQLATYIGWRMHGTLGGLVAGLLFVLPGALIVLALSAIYVAFGQTTVLAAAFLGVKAAVLSIVFEALLRVSKRGLTTPIHRLTALVAFVTMFFFSLPFPLVVLGAGVFGFLTARPQPHTEGTVANVPFATTVRTVLVWSVVWFAPLVGVALFSGQALFADLALFFSKLATVTFGGAYAVLAYMTQDAVQVQGWLTTQEMVDGLGLAETTPGPLILVTEFVGFIAGARDGDGGVINFARGAAAAGVTLWATFAPCFLWVFVGAPYIASLAAKPRLGAALASISAAVVGVILNLSVWFALHVLFEDVERLNWGLLTLTLPQWSSLHWLSVFLAILAAVLLLWLRRSVLLVLAVCAAIAIASSYWLVGQ